MSRSTLPVFRLAKGEHVLSYRDLPILGYRKNGKPIYPIMGASEPPTPAPPTPPVPTPPAPEPSKPTGPVEATDPDTGLGLGFPAETKVDDMKDAEKAHYWRYESKKQQKKVPANLSDLQEKARKFDEWQQSQQTPAEQEIQKVRDETAAATRKEVAAESALTNLRIVLQTRGKSDAEVDGLVEFINPERFLTQDGKVDTARVMAYADGIVPAGSGGGRPGGLPGQGKFGQSATDKSADGRTEAERRGFKSASGKSSLLPQTS